MFTGTTALSAGLAEFSYNNMFAEVVKIEMYGYDSLSPKAQTLLLRKWLSMPANTHCIFFFAYFSLPLAVPMLQSEAAKSERQQWEKSKSSFV